MILIWALVLFLNILQTHWADEYFNTPSDAHMLEKFYT